MEGNLRWRARLAAHSVQSVTVPTPTHLSWDVSVEAVAVVPLSPETSWESRPGRGLRLCLSGTPAINTGKHLLLLGSVRVPVWGLAISA